MSPPYQQSERFVKPASASIVNSNIIKQDAETVPVVSPSFSVNIDFNRNAVSDQNVIPVQKPQKPAPRFPERIPAPLTVATAPPSLPANPPPPPPPQPSPPPPQPSIPPPQPSIPPPQPSPAPIFTDVTSAPILPQAVPAVPGGWHQLEY